MLLLQFCTLMYLAQYPVDGSSSIKAYELRLIIADRILHRENRCMMFYGTNIKWPKKKKNPSTLGKNITFMTIYKMGKGI